ncbi:MAG: peptide chain release factor 1 [Anaerolineae bacterium]
MKERLKVMEARYGELERLLADPQVASDPDKLREYGQEMRRLAEPVRIFRQARAVDDELEEAQALLSDDDPKVAELAREEIAALEEQRDAAWADLERLLSPEDREGQRNVIMEIRAGTGGEEAALFAADLYRMYARFAEGVGWKTELLSTNQTGVGGLKEVVLALRGAGAFARLRNESGVHRVQRVPVTESAGRIHTSTATVAVLPEMDAVEVAVDPQDLEIETYISSGPGGQHMQKNETAVRITHRPTGIVVRCESERSQFQNRQRALAILRARLHSMELQRQQEEIGAARRAQVGTGERSEKIRTYNFPQNRVTDHRINLTLHRLESILDGDLEGLISQVEQGLREAQVPG